MENKSIKREDFDTRFVNTDRSKHGYFYYVFTTTGSLMIELRHGEKTSELRGLIYKVRNELKGGWSEEVYQQKDLGLLVNFAPPRVNIKRVLWDEPELDVYEQYDEIQSRLSEQDKVSLRQIRHHILALARQCGLGYPETMYRKLVAVEMAHHHLSCTSDVGVNPTWQ